MAAKPSIVRLKSGWEMGFNLLPINLNHTENRSKSCEGMILKFIIFSVGPRIALLRTVPIAGFARSVGLRSLWLSGNTLFIPARPD